MIRVNGREVLTTLEELIKPKYTALLLIDIQNDYCSEGGNSDKVGRDISNLKEIPSRVKPLLQAARNCGVLIVHVMMTYYSTRIVESGPWLRMFYKKLLSEGKNLDELDHASSLLIGGKIEGTWGWQAVDEVAPKAAEIIVRKHRSSAFIGTDLDMILRTNEIRSVVSVGVATEGCVDSTARDAQFFDYYSIIIRDCVATGNSKVHEAALSIMSNRIDVVESPEVINIWNRAN